MAEYFTIQLLINNEEVQTDTYSELRDPGRLSDVVGSIAQGTIEHVEQAVQAAHAAFQLWRRTNLSERSALLLQAAELLERESSDLATILARETGVILATFKGELAQAVNAIRTTVEAAQPFFEPKQIEDQQSWVSVEKRPLGVIAGIVPWNAPMVLTMQKLAPALVTGNTIVIKPSPNAPIAVSIILRKIASLFPPGVINVIHGGADVGSTLTTHPLVRKISFTGGAAVAKFVMKDAAASLKRVHFELGGNDPAIVLEDAKVEEVVPKIIHSAFRRSGQVCYAIKRVYIPETIYGAFVEKACEQINRFTIGHGLHENATLGPLNNKMQYDFVKGLVERTKQSSAEVLELGTKLEPEQWDNGYYVHPAVVLHPDPRQEVVSCEQFGPVLPFVSYRTEEEVIRMANDTEYGLSSSVWSSDFEHALRVARQIEAGMTYINEHGLSALGRKQIPFGGVKQSGIGRENTDVGLAEYIEYHGINFHKPVYVH